MSRIAAIFIAFIFPFCTTGTSFDSLKTYLEEMTEMQKFTGTILLAKGDSVVFFESFGPAVSQGERMNQNDSQYLIGSITKTFTATAIMQLFEENKLSLSDPLSKYVSLFPNAENITIRHLLTHRSGIKSYTDLPDMAEWKYDDLTPAELIEKVMDTRSAFEPGSMYAYSNTNYVLLGMIIEQVSGQDFDKYIKKNILEKASMSDTGMDYDQASNLSQGLTPVDGTWIPENRVNPSIPFSAGGLYSSPEDMLAFSNAFFDGDFFEDQTTLDAMLNFEEGFYGLGVYADQTDDQIYFGHNGGIDGYSSAWKYYKDLDLHMIILSNSFFSENEQVVDAAIHAFLNKPIEFPKKREPVQLEVEKLKKLEGTYEIQRGFNLNVFVEGESLMARATGQNAFELFADNDSSFFAMVSGIEVDFDLDESGQAESLTLHQAGTDYRAERLEGKRKVIELDLAELEILVGTYELQPGFNLDIFLEDGRLYGQATGQNMFELFAESRNQFYSLGTGIEIEFKFDENGETESLILYQGGGSYNAPKIED